MIQLGEHIIQMGWNHQLKVCMFDSSLVYEEKIHEQRDKSWLCENQVYRQAPIKSSMEDALVCVCVFFFEISESSTYLKKVKSCPLLIYTKFYIHIFV